MNPTPDKMRRRGKIGVYGPKTRRLQRRLSFEAFGLTFKDANVYMYLGSRSSVNPHINDIQTKVFYETPDRAYDVNPKAIPIGVDPLPEAKTDFSRFGLIDPLSDEQMFRMHIDDFAILGRELIIGDVFELPFFSKNNKLAFWEVTDVDLNSEYEKFIAIIHATPLSSARTTREIPIEQSNDDLMDDIMAGAEEQYSDQVPVDRDVFDETPEKEPVDYRNPLQSSFLDDITKEF